MDYRFNKRYFAGDMASGCGTIAIILGLIGAIILYSGEMVCGILMSILGFGLFYYIQKNRVSDSEYDESVLSQIKNLKKVALEKLGIDEDEVNEVEPILINGYELKDSLLIKKGKDEIWRSNKYQACMIFFSENEVHCYRYNYSTTEKSNTEETDVYFYKDLVSVSTISEQFEKCIDKDKNIYKTIEIEYFKLTTSGGTHFTVAISKKNNAKEKINGMRSLIKSKKLEN